MAKEQTRSVVAKPPNLQAIERMEPEFHRALPDFVQAEAFVRTALTAVRSHENLVNADQGSLLRALLDCAQCGLVPDSILGQAHLVPFWNGKRKVYEVQMIPGYKGLISLACRTGDIAHVRPRAAWVGDDFQVMLGDEASIRHAPSLDRSTFEWDDLLAAYCVVTFKSGHRDFEVLSRAQLEAVRNESKSYTRSKDSPWHEHPVPMGLKTAVIRALKYVPMSSGLMQRAIGIDEQNEAGARSVDVDVRDAVSGVVDEEEKPPKDGDRRVEDGKPLRYVDGMGWLPDKETERAGGESVVEDSTSSEDAEERKEADPFAE